MATDHFQEAERLLRQAAETPADGAAILVARAQVHATLALALAQKPAVRPSPAIPPRPRARPPATPPAEYGGEQEPVEPYEA